MELPPALVAGRPVRLRHQRRRTPCRPIDSQARIFFKIFPAQPPPCVPESALRRQSPGATTPVTAYRADDPALKIQTPYGHGA